MFTCGGSDTPPRVFGSGWPGNSRDVSHVQPGIKYFNTRKREFRHVHLRPRRTVSAITCATTPTASYREISISWNSTEHLHSSEPLKLNPGQFKKHEPPRGAQSVRRFCRCQSLDRHTASITPKERHRSRQLRVFVTAVSSPRLHATARMLWTAPARFSLRIRYRGARSQSSVTFTC